MNRPTMIYEIWIANGEVWGTDRSDFGVEQVHRFKQVFRLSGKHVYFIVVTDEEKLTRTHAIHFAHAVFQGAIKHHTVDLSAL